MISLFDGGGERNLRESDDFSDGNSGGNKVNLNKKLNCIIKWVGSERVKIR